jgi:S1-C subfamily serine protease
MPWQRQKQEFSTSSGFIIDKKRIITNAHAVEYGSLIQVKKRQSEKKYVASVVAVGHECEMNY